MPFFYAFSIRESVVRLMPRLCAARLWLSPLLSNTIRTISRSMRASGWERYLDEKFDEIVEFSELQNFLDVPLKNYSSVMVARIGFALSLIHI